MRSRLSTPFKLETFKLNKHNPHQFVNEDRANLSVQCHCCGARGIPDAIRHITQKALSCREAVKISRENLYHHRLRRLNRHCSNQIPGRKIQFIRRNTPTQIFIAEVSSR